jgi:hypothetical protein
MNKADHSSLCESAYTYDAHTFVCLEKILTGCNSQGKKKRLHGNDAVKSHILAAKTVADIVKSSLVCIGSKTLGGNISLICFRDLEGLTKS